MGSLHEISFPDEIDWQHWCSRWDHMQERYIVRRNERFEIMIRMVQATQENVVQILDLGCGTGSLMLEMLKAFPQAKLIGIDFDPTLLPLARKRLAEFSNRVKLILADLRRDNWLTQLEMPIDVVVSVTSLHWFKPNELTELYAHIGQILRLGGIFLNADHVGSENTRIQSEWEDHREKMRNEQKDAKGEDWENFWKSYMGVLGIETWEIHQRVLNNWEGGVEEGMPLAWHFDKLQAAGFKNIDCFWRCDCDAIYGGTGGRK